MENKELIKRIEILENQNKNLVKENEELKHQLQAKDKILGEIIEENKKRDLLYQGLSKKVSDVERISRRK